MGYYLEIWTRPGHANFGRVIDDPPFREGSWHDGLNLVGDGTLQMPNTFNRFDRILFIDRQTLSNCRSSLVRLRSDIGAGDPVVGEWIPTGLTPTSGKNDPYVDVFGQGIKSILTYAVTQPYDWDGSANWESTFPDWIYGGANILANPGFETQTFIPREYWLLIDATAGTFTLSDGTDTTSPLAFNISDGILEGEIEADITAIDDISVVPLEGVPRGYQLLISATGGTFVLSDPTSNTGNLSAGIGAAALETAIEGLAGVTNVTVSAISGGFQINLHTPATIELAIDTTNLTGGTAQFTVSRTVDGFSLTFVEPPIGVSLSEDDSLLTGSTRLQQVVAGAILPSPWTKSQQISAGTPREYGIYDIFEPSQEQAHSGTWSLKIDPGPVLSDLERYAGAQQVINVAPKGLYQASIWVYPTAPGQSYRLVIRGLDEDLVAPRPLAAGNVTPPANVWTQITVPNVVIPKGDTRVIFRFANIDPSGNPAPFYIDDASFTEGEAPATIGKILGDLYDDATVDHPGRVVWDDDASPGNPYLTLGFTDTVDSNGNAWDRNDLSFKVWQRMDYLQVMQLAVDDYEYEWRIVPDNVETGSWLWQVYNPGTMDTNPNIAILGGSSDVSRQLRRFLPRTAYMVEGELRVTARSLNAGLAGALGRIETARLGRNLPDLSATVNAALADVNDAVLGSNLWSYELVDPQDEPGSAYRIGDTITVHDPPEADGTGRLWDWVVTLTPEKVTHEVEVLEEA